MHSSRQTRIWHWLSGLCLLALAATCLAQADPAAARRAEASPEILAKAESGESQRLIVWFDDDAIQAGALARRSEPGFRRNEGEIDAWELKELAALKAQVIAGTAGTDVQWVRDFETLPAAVVIVTGPAGLGTLLSDPRVSAVSDATKPLPAAIPGRRRPPT